MDEIEVVQVEDQAHYMLTTTREETHVTIAKLGFIYNRMGELGLHG